jgi:hypothetical protein
MEYWNPVEGKFSLNYNKNISYDWTQEAIDLF